MNTDIEKRIPNFIDLLLDMVFLVDENGRIVFANAACERILGYPPSSLIGRPMIDLVLPEDHERTRAEAATVMSGEGRIGFENRYRHKDGHVVHLTWSARWVDPDRLRLGVARDITRQKRAEAMQAAVYAVSEATQNAADADALFADLHRIVADLIPITAVAVAVCLDTSGELSFSYRHLWPDDGTGTPVGSDLCADALAGGKARMLKGKALPTCWEDDGYLLILPLTTHNGPVGVAMLKTPPGEAYADIDRELMDFIAAQAAIAIERTRLKAELLQAALYDELTRLPNRRLLYDRTRQALMRCQRKQSRLGLLYLDVDDFKQVNDSFGHASGDQLLREFATRLAGTVRASDTVARLAGDEFVVLMEDVSDEADVLAVTAKIREALAPAIMLENAEVRIAASVGIALYPDHGDDIEQLLRHADRAMYRAKRDD